MSKKCIKNKVIFKPLYNISPLTISIILVVISILSYIALQYFKTKISDIIYNTLEVAITALLSAGILDLLLDISSINNLISSFVNNIIATINKNNNYNFDDLNDKALSKVQKNLIDANLHNNDDTSAKTLISKDICDFSINELFSNINRTKIYKDYTETIDIQIDKNDNITIIRNDKYVLYCGENDILFEKFIWFSDILHRESFEQESVVLKVNNNLANLNINNVEKTDIENKTIYGLRFVYDIDKKRNESFNIEFEYKRTKPISYEPYTFTFRYYCIKPEITFTFADSQRKYDFNFFSFGNYKTLSRNRNDNKHNEKKQSQNSNSYKLTFDEYTMPGAGYIYWIRERNLND